MTILEELKEYFKNTPIEQIKKEWESLSEWADVGPTLEEYLEEINEVKEVNDFLKQYDI